MPKTYTAAGSAVAGDVYTAAAHNVIVTDVNNFIVPPLVRANHGTTTQSLTNATLTYVQWDAEDYDTDGMFTTSDNTKITINTTGVYLVTATITFATNGTGSRLMSLMKNPSSPSDFGSAFAGCWMDDPGAGAETVLSVSSPISLVATDVIRVMAFQSSGGALNIGAVPSWSQQSHFAATWIGRTA
jgi:PKD repeat protein